MWMVSIFSTIVLGLGRVVLLILGGKNVTVYKSHNSSQGRHQYGLAKKGIEIKGSKKTCYYVNKKGSCMNSRMIRVLQTQSQIV